MSSTVGVTLSTRERDSLDRLFGHALLDDTVCRRLVERRDEALLIQYRLPLAVQRWLASLPAASLAELAQAIVTHSLRSEPLLDNRHQG